MVRILLFFFVVDFAVYFVDAVADSVVDNGVSFI